MPAIKITGFQGELPKIDPRHLPDTAAADAQDVRLDDGILTPIRRSILTTTGLVANAQTIYDFNGTWLSWAGVVHAAPGPVAEDRLYYTGDGAPKMRIGATTYDLALPKPANTLTGVVSGSGSGNNITRVYVFTYVTDQGEESEPSPASAQITLQPGQTVTLSNFDAVPAGRVTKQRIYRTQTGNNGTGLYLIDERAVTAADYVDTIPVDQFQEALPSLNYNAPPADLQGLVAMDNGMMAAFKGKQIYFCEPYQPHAWPEIYVLTTKDTIVGMAYIGNILVVMTEGNTVICGGSMPEAMQMDRLEADFPCINVRSIVDLGYAVVYASNNGLVSVNGAGQHTLVTDAMFNRDSWQEMSPQTFVCTHHDGKYCAFYDYVDQIGKKQAGMLLIDLGSPWLARSAITGTAAFNNRKTNAMIYVAKGETNAYRYDAPLTARENMYWKTKEFILPYPENFGALRVEGDDGLTDSELDYLESYKDVVVAANDAKISGGLTQGSINSHSINAVSLGGDALDPVPATTTEDGAAISTIRVIADDKIVFETSTLNKTHRLPSGFKARKWEIDVSGNVRVDQIHMARTIAELART